jgi:hypothetical protein
MVVKHKNQLYKMVKTIPLSVFVGCTGSSPIYIFEPYTIQILQAHKVYSLLS